MIMRALARILSLYAPADVKVCSARSGQDRCIWMFLGILCTDNGMNFPAITLMCIWTPLWSCRIIFTGLSSCPMKVHFLRLW